MRNHLMLLANMASLVVAIYICCNFTLHLLPLLVGTALCLFNVGQIVCQVNNQQTSLRWNRLRTLRYQEGVAKPENIRKFEQFIKKESKRKILEQDARGYGLRMGSYRRNSEIVEDVMIGRLQDNDVEDTPMFQSGPGIVQAIKGRLAERTKELALTDKQVAILSPNDSKVIPTNQPLQIKPGKLQACVQLIHEVMGASLETVYDEIEKNFQLVNNSLLRCFAITLSPCPKNRQQISKRELVLLLNLIERERTVPKKYVCLLSLIELVGEIKEIRRRLGLIPDIDESPSFIRLMLYLQCLRIDFQEQRIVMGSSSSTERHSFSVQDNGLICYNRRQELKSRNCELIVLLFLLEIYRKYERTGKSIIKEIAMYVRK